MTKKKPLKGSKHGISQKSMTAKNPKTIIPKIQKAKEAKEAKELKSTLPKRQRVKKPIEVAIIMGSDSDLPKMQGAIDTLIDFGIAHEVRVISAHRTPDFMLKYAFKAYSRGIKVIIAGAGGAAHLPGMIASASILPVIGVPISSKQLNGLDSLLSIAQMPKGVPVATMAVDSSVNAGLLAARIIGLRKGKVEKQLHEFQKKQNNRVRRIDGEVRKTFGVLNCC